MKRHDNIDLWSFAARQLPQEDQRFAEEHLLDCPHCSATLEKVQRAQSVLGDARLAQPQLRLAKADAALAREISRRLLRQAKPVRWGLVLAPVAVAAAALVAFAAVQWPVVEVSLVGTGTPAASQSPAVIQSTEVDGALRVERAVELAADGKAVRSGGQVSTGEVLSTGNRGVAMLKLPDTSTLRLAASTRVGLSTVTKKQVELKLERGRVAVHAAHVPREAFTLRTGDVAVHVLGTTFAVTRGADFVEVAVAEGRVGVESPRGLPFFVSSGERVRVGTTSWRPVSRAITGVLKDELREVSAAVPASGGPPVPVATRPAAAPAQTVGQPPPAPAPEPVAAASLVEARPATSEWEQPMPSRAPIGLRGIAEPNPPGKEAHPEEPAARPEAPDTSTRPAAGATSARTGRPQGVEVPAAAAASAPEPARTERPQGVEVPAQAPDTSTRPAASPSVNGGASVASAPAAPPVAEIRGPMPEDLEELFLMRAERALRNGGCDRYLLGLADIAEDPQKTVRQERARIAMARCQQALGQSEAAALEFARYARDFPKGLFAREATAAAAAQPAGTSTSSVRTDLAR
jgi:FecR protein